MSIGNEDCLYHFCNFDAFKSIVEKNEFWLSESGTMNDSKELVWFAENIKPLLMRRFEQQPSSFKEKYKNLFSQIAENMYSDYFSKDAYYHMFIMCLSTNGDLLSQWRGYTSDGDGISIGLNKKILLELFEKQNSSPATIGCGEIDYDSRSTSKISNSEKYILDIVDKHLFPQLDEIKHLDELNFATNSIAVFNKFFKNMFFNAILVKSPFFSEECEVRLYIWEKLDFDGRKLSDNVVLSPIQHRLKNGKDTPYIKMNFSKFFNLSDLISEVIIGPKCQESTENITALLRTNGFSSAKVRKSDGFGIYR